MRHPLRSSALALLGSACMSSSSSSSSPLPPAADAPATSSAVVLQAKDGGGASTQADLSRLALPASLEAVGLEQAGVTRSDADALAEASRGRLREAAARCASSDCYAQVARAGVERLGAPVYPITTQICVRATDPHACHRDVVEQLAQEAPVATAPPEDWTRLIQTAAVIETTWVRREAAALAQTAADYLWSAALTRSYAALEADDSTAAPLSFLPAAAHPHVRAALVSRVARAGAIPPPETLEDWLLRLPPGADQGAGIAGTVRWGAGVRPAVVDPGVDLRVCVLLASGLDGQALPDGRWRDAVAAVTLSR